MFPPFKTVHFVYACMYKHVRALVHACADGGEGSLSGVFHSGSLPSLFRSFPEAGVQPIKLDALTVKVQGSAHLGPLPSLLPQR